MIKNFLIFVLFCFYTSCIKAASDGFGKQIFSEPPPILNESVTEETDEMGPRTPGARWSGDQAAHREGGQSGHGKG